MDTLYQNPEHAGTKLPRRDLWLLPLVAILTVFVLSAAAELGARIGWPEQKLNSCEVPDSTLGYRFKPHCTSVMKAAEGPWFSNTYNNCGFRSPRSCLPVPKGTRRVALIGSSTAEGYLVPYSDTIAARLAKELTAGCRAPVDVQNLGGMGYFASDRLVRRFNEALALHPNVILLVVTPYDLQTGIEENDPAQVAKAAAQTAFGARDQLFYALRESRAFVIAQHFHFQNMATYLPLYLNYGDKADFLRPPFTPAWQERLRRFDSLVSDMSNQTQRITTAFAIAFVPQEAEIALMARRPLPPRIDPDALPHAIAEIAARHNVHFIDTSVALLTRSRPERLYYQVDGHLSGAGQPLAAALIANQFSAEIFPACRKMQSGNRGLPPG